MSRPNIRELKRAVRTRNDAAAMLELLDRSVKFGHKKLALLRCLQAERMGIMIDPSTLSYCQHVADAMPEDVLHEIISRASN